jgi:hypothetical protein
MLQARRDFVAGLPGHPEPFRPLPRRGQVVSSSVAIQAAPPERSAISRPTGDVAEPSDRQDRSESRGSAMAVAAGQNAGGRWGEGRCPGFTHCRQGYGQVQAASSAHQSFEVVNPTAWGRSAGVYPGKGDAGIRPSTGRASGGAPTLPRSCRGDVRGRPGRVRGPEDLLLRLRRVSSQTGRIGVIGPIGRIGPGVLWRRESCCRALSLFDGQDVLVGGVVRRRRRAEATREPSA